MIEKRLNGCTFVYEEEFEVLAKTFESLQAEVVIQRDRENDLRAKLAAQEAVNTQLNNFMESVGYDLIQGDNQRSLNKVYGKDTAADIIDCVIQIQDEPDLVPTDVINAIAEGDKLLDSKFNFYGFEIKMSKSQTIDIVNRQLLRFYKKKLFDLAEEKEAIICEMDSMRALMQGFK